MTRRSVGATILGSVSITRALWPPQPPTPSPVPSPVHPGHTSTHQPKDHRTWLWIHSATPGHEPCPVSLAMPLPPQGRAGPWLGKSNAPLLPAHPRRRETRATQRPACEWHRPTATAHTHTQSSSLLRLPRPTSQRGAPEGGASVAPGGLLCRSLHGPAPVLFLNECTAKIAIKSPETRACPCGSASGQGEEVSGRGTRL